jgi:enamine deaminase RidA (YjgF/YER057c/UK114 family)
VSAQTPAKAIVVFGVPWENQFGYVQGVRVADTVFISGQFSHDMDGQIVAPADLGLDGRLEPANMAAQIRRAYANACKALEELGAEHRHVVEETLYVTDIEAASTASVSIRKSFYGQDRPDVACTIVEIRRLARPGQLVEIKFVAKL